VTDAITFAVVGHDEAATLERAVRQALDAARPADAVWFVDSASTDGSGSLASALGVEVVEAPLGKGRAVAVALERCATPWLCTLDADLLESEANLAGLLRDAVAEGGTDMVTGAFDTSFRRTSVTRALYHPLVGALFPEAVDPELRVPLTGYRAWRAALDVAPLPEGFGLETHLNVLVPLLGGRVRTIDVGRYLGPRRYGQVPRIGHDVGAAVLDLAARWGRLDPALRPAWEAWVEAVVAVIATQPGAGEEDDEYFERLDAAAARPLPRAR
jgi:glucosyl-3-phosphoglycerate synthase